MADEISIYIDETYLGGGGEIRAGVAIPAGCHAALDSAVDALLRGPPKQQLKTFHGHRIRSKNQAVYAKFLQYGVNVCALVAEATPLRSILTLRGSTADADNLSWLNSQVESAAGTHAAVPSGLLAEVVNQALWVHENLEHICREPVSSPFRLVVDNKHRYAQQTKEQRLVVSDRRLARLETGRVCTAITNAVLGLLVRDGWCPRFTSVEFVDDADSRPLQLADLLTNLTYAAIRHEKGHFQQSTALKHSLWRRVQPEPVPAQVLSGLDVVDGKLVCSDPDTRYLVVFQALPE